MAVRFWAFMILFAGSASAAGAATHTMPPGLEPTPFQDFIDGAAFGDTVLVPPGEYYQAVLRSGIHIKAAEGPEKTLLRVAKGEGVDSLAVLEGFHIRAKGRDAMSVVEMTHSKAHLVNCVIEGGWAGIWDEYGDLRIENCRVLGSENGIWMFESKGMIRGTEISGCDKGITLKSGSARIIRNDLHHNGVGIYLLEHSEPQIGGSLATGNRFRNHRVGIWNKSNLKRNGIRTLDPQTIRVPYNYWGTDCPTDKDFWGPVEFSPWADEKREREIKECPPEGSE